MATLATIVNTVKTIRQIRSSTIAANLKVKNKMVNATYISYLDLIIKFEKFHLSVFQFLMYSRKNLQSASISPESASSAILSVITRIS